MQQVVKTRQMKKHSPRHIIIKLLKTRNKEKFLQTEEEKTSYKTKELR